MIMILDILCCYIFNYVELLWIFSCIQPIDIKLQSVVYFVTHTMPSAEVKLVSVNSYEQNGFKILPIMGN